MVQALQPWSVTPTVSLRARPTKQENTRKPNAKIGKETTLTRLTLEHVIICYQAGSQLATEQRLRQNYFQDVFLGQPDYPLPTSFISEGRVGFASLPAGKQLPTHGFCGLD